MKIFWIDAEPISDPHPYEPDVYNTYIAQSHEPCVEEKCERKYIEVVEKSVFDELQEKYNLLLEGLDD